MNTKIVSILSLLLVLTSKTVFGGQEDALNLSESEIINIINGKIEKVQDKQHKAIKQQKGTVTQRQLIETYKRQPVQNRAVTAPVRRPAKKAVRRVNLSAIPAWRKAASPTMTRSPDDALLGAAKNRNMNLLQQLLAEGADVNHQNFNGETALHIAASLGNIQMVQYLINQGANVNARTGTLWMPIHHAIRFNHPKVANFLISRKALLRKKTIDGFTALDFAKKSTNPQIQAIARKYGY
jgi:hypothetical protein